jgi:hypothetical protein
MRSSSNPGFSSQVTGRRGPKGDSAYQVAVQLGFVGTEQQWITSLKGDTGQGTQGNPGPPGVDGSNGYTPRKGIDYTDGIDGKEIELQNSGTYIQWRYIGDVSWANLILVSDLKGNKGDKGDRGDTGLTGSNGPSISSVAFVNNDIVFTKDDTNTVILSNAKVTLKGADGANGINGTNGSSGTSATIVVGTVSTGAAGSAVTVVNGGTPSAASFNFSIPKGDTTYVGDIDGGNASSIYGGGQLIINGGNA